MFHIILGGACFYICGRGLLRTEINEFVLLAMMVQFVGQRNEHGFPLPFPGITGPAFHQLFIIDEDVGHFRRSIPIFGQGGAGMLRIYQIHLQIARLGTTHLVVGQVAVGHLELLADINDAGRKLHPFGKTLQ